VRGDNNTKGGPATRSAGSPPRAWGQHLPLKDSCFLSRFTPTCVGTTSAPRRSLSRPSVHPHVRGDNATETYYTPIDGGSPPRAWGQRNGGGANDYKNRFTPTCVGTTTIAHQHAMIGTVHPHVRGDNSPYLSNRRLSHGSPPRAWGQRSPIGSEFDAARFTPTCVGTTVRLLLRSVTPPVHPHVRGDNVPVASLILNRHGSPPRAWGQPRARPSTSAIARFTPTCVGTTFALPYPRRERPVHPHVRGDNWRSRGKTGKQNGSPPRAWGQHPISTNTSPPIRFTPTCVGTTYTRSPYTHSPAVHPHVRGDNAFMLFPSFVCVGSPPRAWGQQLHLKNQLMEYRFTPTCVGTTHMVSLMDSESSVHPHVRGDNIPKRCLKRLRNGSPPRAWGQRQ